MKINRDKTMLDFLYDKKAFLTNENIGFKNPQNLHFFVKGLVHGFGVGYKGLHEVTG